MKSGTEFKPTAGFSVLCIGEAGAGHTRLAMSFPSPGFIDCDGNLASAARVADGKPWFFDHAFMRDGKEIPVVDRWNRAMEISKEMCANPKVLSVVVDSFGPLCTWGLEHCENELRKAGVDTKKEYLAKYNNFINLINNYITFLKVSGKFVIINAHQLIEKAELVGTVSYIVDMPGRLSQNLGRSFNDVWVVSATSDPSNKTYGAKYEICTKPTGLHVNPKTSLDLPPRIDVTGKTPKEMWAIFGPKLPGYVA